MHSLNIPKTQWAEFFEVLSRECEGEPVDVSLHEGAPPATASEKTASHGLITFEARGALLCYVSAAPGRFTILLSGGDRGLIRLPIEVPLRVVAYEEQKDIVSGFDIESVGNRHLTLRFVDRVAPEAPIVSASCSITP